MNETKNVFVRFSNYTTLNIVANTQVSDLTLEDSSCRVKLNGHTLTIRSREHELGEAAQVVVGGTEEAPGKIVWLPRDAGSILMLR